MNTNCARRDNPLRLGTHPLRIGKKTLRVGTKPLRVGTKPLQEGTTPKKIAISGGLRGCLVAPPPESVSGLNHGVPCVQTRLNDMI